MWMPVMNGREHAIWSLRLFLTMTVGLPSPSVIGGLRPCHPHSPLVASHTMLYSS